MRAIWQLKIDELKIVQASCVARGNSPYVYELFTALFRPLALARLRQLPSQPIHAFRRGHRTALRHVPGDLIRFQPRVPGVVLGYIAVGFLAFGHTCIQERFARLKNQVLQLSSYRLGGVKEVLLKARFALVGIGLRCGGGGGGGGGGGVGVWV